MSNRANRLLECSIIENNLIAQRPPCGHPNNPILDENKVVIENTKDHKPSNNN